jgi:hypothetical protein
MAFKAVTVAENVIGGEPPHGENRLLYKEYVPHCPIPVISSGARGVGLHTGYASQPKVKPSALRFT